MCAVVSPAVPFPKAKQSLHGSPSAEPWSSCRDPTTPSNSTTRSRTPSNSTMKYGMNLLPQMSERKRKSVYKGLTKWSKKRREKAYLLTPSASCLLPLLLFEVSGKRERRRRLHEKMRRDEMRDSERRKIEKDREVMNDMRILWRQWDWGWKIKNSERLNHRRDRQTVILFEWDSSHTWHTSEHTHTHRKVVWL